MEKLSKLAMPDVKSGTPQEKMNAVKKVLQSLEMVTEAYNQIVPVINAKIDWLSEAEKVAKDNTQDKKIDELIATNKKLLGRIVALESKDKSIESLDKRLDFIRRTYSEKWEQAEFARTKFQQLISEQITAIETPREVDLSDIEQRLDDLESKPDYKYDDAELKERISRLESEIKKLMG